MKKERATLVRGRFSPQGPRLSGCLYREDQRLRLDQEMSLQQSFATAAGPIAFFYLPGRSLRCSSAWR